MQNAKNKGKFYTPPALAEWIVFHLENSFQEPIDVLEPSCGSGNFIDALNISSILFKSLDAVEVEPNAIEKIKQPANIKKFKVFKADFLTWESSKKYSLVIGNPPYIVKKLLLENQATYCKSIHTQHELRDCEVSNIWTSFLLKSSDFLNDEGVLAFVLPTEILQVKYAEEIRSFLAAHFSRIELITFRHLAFEGIEQDTVVLFAYKKCISGQQGVFIKEVDGISGLLNITPNFTHLPLSSLSQKWTTAILSEEDISLVNTLFTRLSKVKDYCHSVAGIVTARSDFFILTQQSKDKFKLGKNCKKIIPKGFYVNSCVDFTEKKFELLKERNIPCFLLDTNGQEDFHHELKHYLALGKGKGVHEGYKCRQRKRWHDVPGVKKGEGFFFRRSHDYPKCMKNSADVYVTDSAYLFDMREHYAIEDFIFSFYNSLTLLAAEMTGRYYGGGVLELTPNEFKNLPIPFTSCSNFNFFSAQFEEKANLEDIVVNNDDVILSKQMGLSSEEIDRIQKAYKKMKHRRMRDN